MHLARLVSISRAEEIPEQFRGFVNFQANMEGHEVSEKEKVAMLVIEGTSCYVPVFLDRMKRIEDLELRLAEQQAEMPQDVRSLLEKNVS
ncbi:MAG: DUF749 family protein [Methanomassiliicoccales archaeon]|nr:DUF749 family protein [Methanomassiliicoccales archaeon]